MVGNGISEPINTEVCRGVPTPGEYWSQLQGWRVFAKGFGGQEKKTNLLLVVVVVVVPFFGGGGVKMRAPFGTILGPRFLSTFVRSSFGECFGDTVVSISECWLSFGHIDAQKPPS